MAAADPSLHYSPNPTAGGPDSQVMPHWILGASEEIGRKSEKCLVDLSQVLSGLMHSADHILKSTPVMSGQAKDIT